ncbi:MULTISPECIES: hypothetical protein [unclassified Sphingobacterium]|uniref:hypothetical protein n=1 Tax=unclassified Sphingobacterium TaxID=2609468 RepID=UPI0020C3D07E|nr:MULTISPECIES: hypothetical protein [unclassified Sphingobacterium]
MGNVRSGQINTEYFSTAQSIYQQVDIRTIDRLLEENKDELSQTEYEVFSAVRLRLLKDLYTRIIAQRHENDNNVGLSTSLV